MSYLNGPVVFPTFFNLSLNFTIRSSRPEPQSAPSLVFADCIERLHPRLQKVCLIKAMVFPVVMYGCESLTIKKAEC